MRLRLLSPMTPLSIALLGLGLACAGPAAEPTPTPEPTTSEEPALSDPAAARYQSWLDGRGLSIAPDIIKDAGNHGIEGWTFFMVSRKPGQKKLAAGVSGDTVVYAKDGANWDVFLKAGEPERLHEAIAWLKGAWTTTGPGDNSAAQVEAKYPVAAAEWAGPVVTEADGTVRFEGWFAEPPSFEPFQFVVEAPVGGEATFQTRYPR